MIYRYTPATGTLSDLWAEWEQGGGPFQPLAGGGIRFCADQGKPSLPPEKIELVRCRQEGNAVQAAWRCTAGRRSAELQYTFELVQKSMLITVRCPGGEVGEFCVGKAVGLSNPRLVTLPYLTGDQQRPAVVVAGPPEKPLFVSAFLDYYLSNASALWAANSIDNEGVVYNGGSRYLPKTDGRRNNCYERLFLTVSPRFEETLPNVANPQSPWMHVTGERLWIAHGASDRQRDYDLFRKVARYGMTKLVITDHETGWRDGGESFTFRTRAAPGRGGDPSQADYARKLHALGFRYGIYNNYYRLRPGQRALERGLRDAVARRPMAAGLGPLLQSEACPGGRVRSQAGPDHSREVPSRHGLLRRPHVRSRLGITSIMTPACRAPALSPPRSTPTARSCSTRRRPGTGRCTARATTTGTIAA